MGGGDQWIEVPGGAGRGSSISVAAVIQLTARVEPMRAEPSRWRPARLLGSLALIALARIDHRQIAIDNREIRTERRRLLPKFLRPLRLPIEQ